LTFPCHSHIPRERNKTWDIVAKLSSHIAQAQNKISYEAQEI
jgi:hypothetical protein